MGPVSLSVPNWIDLLSELQKATAYASISRNSLFDGELICYQHQNGYRFSIDSVLLAHFVSIKHGDAILDLGTGSGIIAMILLYRWQDRICQVSGIEVQQGLANLAGKNLSVNSFDNLGSIIQGDIREINNLVLAESYDRIVCNPPFYALTSGRINKNHEAQMARHQILATLQDFLCASAFAVKNGGEIFFIYPAERISEFVSLAEKYRLEVKKIQFIYGYPSTTNSARLVLIRCCKNGGRGVEVLPPLYIYCQKNGDFSPEVRQYYQKNKDRSLQYD